MASRNLAVGSRSGAYGDKLSYYYQHINCLWGPLLSHLTCGAQATGWQNMT